MTEEQEGKETTEQTPTPEEQGETLQAKLDALEAKHQQTLVQLGEKEKGFKTLQRDLNKVQNEASQIETLQEQIRILGGGMAELMGRQEANLEDLPREAKVDLQARFDEIRSKAEIRKLEAKSSEIRDRALALGFPEDDDRVENIRLHVLTGDFEGAVRRLRKLEGTEKKPPETETVKPEDLVAKIREEERLKAQKEAGLLDTDTAGPSAGGGGGLTVEKLREQIETPMSIKELQKISDGYFNAWKKGKLK